MREILFKAKRLDNGEWVEGYYCSKAKTTFCFKEDYEKNPISTHYYILVEAMTDWGLPNRFSLVEINPDTLCQYTGLSDKNSVKIWENDIIKAILDEYFPEDITYESVAWHEASFYTYENNRPVDVLDKWDTENFEVCGNIFDNPELLGSNSAS